MKSRQISFRRVLISTFRRKGIDIWDRLGPYAESFLIFAIGILVFVVLFVRFRIGGPSDWAAFAGAIVLAAVTVLIVKLRSRQHAILIELTIAYLIAGGRPLLDHLLGKLIGGGWRRKHMRPGDALFNVLEELCKGPDWEMRRRISEALAALGQIDAKRTLRIAKVLREDWEPSRWRSDVRRRTIEELIIPAWPGALLLLDKLRKEDIALLLRLREKDEVYAVMAVAEVLREWESIEPRMSGELRNDLLEFTSKTFSQDESRAIEELLELLDISKGKNVMRVLEKLAEMSRSTNIFTRIAASRNVLLVSDRFPGKTLNLMQNFTDPSQPNNVRRPISREVSASFLVEMITSKGYASQAKEVLWNLLKDKDEITRITAFDMAEMLGEKDRGMLLQICDFIAANETSSTLRERAQHVREELLANGDIPVKL